MKNPCKKCLVKAACTVTCDLKLKHNNLKEKLYDNFNLVVRAVPIIIIAFGSLITICAVIFTLGFVK